MIALRGAPAQAGARTGNKPAALAGKGHGMIITPADHARRVRSAGAALALVFALVLAGCGEEGGLGFPAPREEGAAASDTGGERRSAKLVERDVEAPEVFQVSEAGLWDGRPSLGGVWIAHPDVDEPERVIIRNTANGRDVIGALFRRERQNPGPKLQVSSDAAAALGMLAGQPARLEVVALRRETASKEAPQETPPGDAETLAAPAEVEAAPLDPVEAAAAALDENGAAAATTPVEEASAAPPPEPPAPAPAPSGGLERPYVQIGIFSMEENARDTATAMRQQGLAPELRRQTSQGKTFWRVLVGPAASAGERAEILEIVKAAGFTDAYAVRD